MRALLRQPRGRIVVVGGGRQGVAAGRLLASLGASFVVADDGPLHDVKARFAVAGIKDVSATDIAGADCEKASLIILSAGVPRAHVGLRTAIAHKVPIINEIDLAAAQLEAATFVGITGTNGKSTTTTIAGAIAKEADPNAFVGGNLGTPLCDAVVDGLHPRLVVIELSSYQLESLTVPRFRSAIVTNLSPDHLDRYPSPSDYYAAKARILEMVADDGGSSINRRDALCVELLDAKARGTHFDFDVESGREGIEIEGHIARVVRSGLTSEIMLASPHLVGRHNLQNAAAAIAAMVLAGCSIETCRRGILAYRGIAHRLERISEVDGVVFVNDSKATNVDAAIKAVSSFDHGIHLIAGGRGKGASYAPLVDASRGRVACVYAIGEDADLIASAFAGACRVVQSGDLSTAFALAVGAADHGDTVLLAPACASFDQWKNYEERGNAFASLAREHARAKSGENP
jgi:UDP-N-acetylmuramoylalanine--D-glutamate ligase